MSEIINVINKLSYEMEGVDRLQEKLEAVKKLVDEINSTEVIIKLNVTTEGNDTEKAPD